MSHPIENIMQSSMDHIKRLADVNTVIGDPITAAEDTLILPVSKVSLGMLVGGGEYPASQGTKKEPPADGNYPFIGASTLGMSLTPLAFLAVQNGTVRVLPAKQECPSDRIIDLLPQMIETAERLISEYAGKADRKEKCLRFEDRRSLNTERKAEAEANEGFKVNIEYGDEDGAR